MALFVKQFLIFVFLLESFLYNNQIKTDIFFKKNFSIEEKLGQIVMLNVSPETPDETIIKAIKDYKIGNFNLIGSFTNEKDLKKKIDLIYKEVNKYLKLPPLIAVDEEGAIQRIAFINSVQQKDLKDKNEAYLEAYRRGVLLKQFKINIIFAPVLDFTENPNDYIWPRTFQKNKKETIDLAEAMIDGFYKAGILPIVKHFPGYINSSLDPHGKFYEYQELNSFSTNIEIFRQVLQEKGVIGVMVAHLLIEEFKDKPITRSKEFTDYFKKEFNYAGLLVTDSLGMAAYRLNDSFSDSILETIRAKYDLLILSSNTNVSFLMMDSVLKNINDPEIQEMIEKAFLKLYLIKIFFLKN